MINLKNSEFFYDSYPFAIVKNIFEKEIYDDLKKEFPDPNDEKFYSSDYSKKNAIGKFNKFQIDNFLSENFNNVMKNRKTSKLIYNFFKSLVYKFYKTSSVSSSSSLIDNFLFKYR